MSDNLPIDMQTEIINRLPVNPLMQLRSVSTQWKSLIENADSIKGYGVRHTKPRSFILRYEVNYTWEVFLVDDDNNETFEVQQQLAPPYVGFPFPLLQQYHVSYVVGACHGLLCFNGILNDNWMLVICNPSIRKYTGIVLLSFDSHVFGFGVCPVNLDPTVVKILCADNMPWDVEIFTLSSGVWNVIPSGDLPRQSVRLNNSTQVVLDGFIYWGAHENISTNDGESTTKDMVVSFDLITKEFKVVDLPDTLTNELISRISVSKLRGSLVVYGNIKVEGAMHCGVWVMERDSSFKKLFSIGAHVSKIVGLTKNSETIFETQNEEGGVSTLNVYDPCSQQIKNLGISGVVDSFFMDSYKESLLLLDRSDLHIYCDHN